MRVAVISPHLDDLECGQSLYAPTEWEAGSLDDRCRMSLIVEALK